MQMISGIAILAGLMSFVSLLVGVSPKADAPPAIGAWAKLLAGTPEYRNLEGPEVVLIGEVAITGSYPEGKPEEATWRWHLMVDKPWVTMAARLAAVQTARRGDRIEKPIRGRA